MLAELMTLVVETVVTYFVGLILDPLVELIMGLFG